MAGITVNRGTRRRQRGTGVVTGGGFLMDRYLVDNINTLTKLS
jgi:hypothetical protein